MSKKALPKPKLSFDLDEEDDDNDGGDFQVRKSKESRKFKKMRQAPGISESIVVASEPVVTVSTVLGGAYSSENLAQLRKSQMFVATENVEVKKDSMEGIELSGEAAEEFVEMTERIAMKKNNNLGEYVSFDGGAGDIDAIHSARLVNKAMLKGTGDDRIYTSAVGKPEKRIGFDLEQSNDSDWEDEIIQRGVINKTALSSKNAAVTERAQQTNALSKSAFVDSSMNKANTSGNGEITVADLMKTVQLAVDKLSFSEEEARRKIEQISVEVTRALTEEAQLRGKVEIGVKKLNVAQDMKYFFAGVVGMLRDKTSDLSELNMLVAAGIQERWELLQQRRLEEQEDVLYRLREAALLISVGSYTPTGILTPAPAVVTAESQPPELDAFGRVKAEAMAATDPLRSVAALKRREDRRLRDRVLLADTAAAAGHLTATDREYLLANRLADAALTAYSDGDRAECAWLFQQLDASSGLYNAKGEAVDFTQRADMLAQAATAATADVEPELCSVPTIVQRLLEFKGTYPEEFQTAFIADSAVELFQPLISLDLVFVSTDLLRGDSSLSLQTADPTADPARHAHLSFKQRPWFASIVHFSSAVSASDGAGLSRGEASAGLGMSGNGKAGSMASMAAQINNLFDRDGQEDGETETVLTMVVDGTMLPWLRSTLLSTLDTYSSLQCTVCIALLNEVKELCSSRLTRSLPNTVIADIELAFADQVGKICLPQLKLARSKVNVDTQKVEGSSDTHSISVSTAGAEGSVDLAGLVGSGEDFAHSYLLHQLHRMQMSLQHMLAFRLQKLVRPEAAAKTAWLVLVDQARPVVMKLLKVGQWKDKCAVLDLCTVVLSLITGIQISATRGAGNSLFDAQLSAWKIPPAQFRPFKAIVEKLLKAFAAAATEGHPGSSHAKTESPEVVEWIAELSLLLASF